MTRCRRTGWWRSAGDGNPAFGDGVRIPAPEVVEALAQKGPRLRPMDNYHNRWNPTPSAT